MAAGTAVGPKVMQPFQLSALALPVPYRVFNKIQLRGFTKIIYWKDRPEHGLQPRVFTLGRQQIHLKESVIRLPLDFNKIRDPDGGLYPGEIIPFAARAVVTGNLVLHIPPRLNGQETLAVGHTWDG